MATRNYQTIQNMMSKLTLAERELLIEELQIMNHEAVQASGTTGTQLLQAVRAMNYSSGQTDVAERSREILNEEFGAYLAKRMNKGE